jgi:hypothetical protein
VQFPGGNWASRADAYALSEWAYRDLRTSGWELMGALKLPARLRATRVLIPLTSWASLTDAYALSEWAYRDFRTSARELMGALELPARHR